MPNALYKVQSVVPNIILYVVDIVRILRPSLLRTKSQIIASYFTATRNKTQLTSRHQQHNTSVTYLFVPRDYGSHAISQTQAY
jgi:hypothetical protein